MREDERRDPTLVMCLICERGYGTNTPVHDYRNDGQMREDRTWAL